MSEILGRTEKEKAIAADILKQMKVKSYMEEKEENSWALISELFEVIKKYQEMRVINDFVINFKPQIDKEVDIIPKITIHIN